MPEKYKGPIGPANAMSAHEPEFITAYSEAVDVILAAVMRFETITGRIASQIALNNIDVTTVASPVHEYIRCAQIDFLPKPDEVAY